MDEVDERDSHDRPQAGDRDRAADLGGRQREEQRAMTWRQHVHELSETARAELLLECTHDLGVGLR